MRASVAAAFSSSAPKSSLSGSEDRIAGCGGCRCEEDLCSWYACHAFAVRWRLNACDAESSMAVRTTSVGVPETLDGDDGVREQRSEVAPASEDEVSRTYMLDVRSSEACAEFGEPTVAAVTERSIIWLFRGFITLAPRGVDGHRLFRHIRRWLALIVNLKLSIVGIVIHFLRARAPWSLLTFIDSHLLDPFHPFLVLRTIAVAFIFLFLYYSGTTASKSCELNAHVCPCVLPGARPPDIR